MWRLLLPALALAFLLGGDLTAASGEQAQRNFEIVAIDLAGRQTNLTRNPADDLSPAVARDGRIVFLSTRAGGSADLYVMDGKGRNARRLTTTGVAWAEDLERSQASWSPTGDKIAFDDKYMAEPPSCLQHCASFEVFVVGSDGSGLKQVALRARAPTWSPDGRRLAYESGIESGYYDAGGVTITRLDGSGSVQVKANNPYSDVGPVWSPSGDELAFEAQRSDGSPPTSVYVVRADGRRTRRLGVGHNPSWSPDARRLAFVYDYRLVTTDRNGKGRRRVSPKGEFVVDAAWSPKGGTIAYVAGTKADPHAYVPKNLRVETVSADGRHVHVLARTPALFVDGRLVWTRDGERILVIVASP